MSAVRLHKHFCCHAAASVGGGLGMLLPVKLYVLEFSSDNFKNEMHTLERWCNIYMFLNQILEIWHCLILKDILTPFLWPLKTKFCTFYHLIVLKPVFYANHYCSSLLTLSLLMVTSGQVSPFTIFFLLNINKQKSIFPCVLICAFTSCRRSEANRRRA